MLRLAVPLPSLPTIGRIAADLGVPVHRVAYVVRTRHIRPSATAGRLRLFDKAAVALIRRALEGKEAQHVR